MTERHLARRFHLLDRIGDGVLVLPTAPERIRSRDSHHPYRPDSDFWYLTGFPEPDAVLVLVGGASPQSRLFCREKQAERELWDGYRYGPEGAAASFGFDAAEPIEHLADRLPELIADRAILYTPFGSDPDWDRQIAAALASVRSRARTGVRAPTSLADPLALLHAMRLIKDAAEIDWMRQSATIASTAHRKAMQATRPGAFEYQVEAALIEHFRQHDTVHAYPPIVAGGAHACVLHYVQNNAVLRNGDLLLIDAGCERAGYASDITRTFPVNGRFAGPQRDAYEIVLEAQAAAIAAVRPGVRFDVPHHAALRVLTQGLVDLGVLVGCVDGLLESEAYKPYYMHRTSHWLGLDVHDAGAYRDAEGPMPLSPNMVLTIEPGLYLRPDDAVPAALHQIGIRIEDDVRVTPTGSEVLSHAPKSVAEIEATMARD